MTQDRQHEKIICLFVKGDSMRPTIQDGSLVAIDIEDRVETVNGKIYAVALPDDGGVTIKRVYHQHGFLTLLADNRDEPGYPYCLPLKGLQYNPICGRVVWCWNRLD
jgi:phage repressor protein C with HTH and peptisase S24 domain